MRWFVPLVLLGVSCSGTDDDTTFVEPENCDNGVDDNDNGLVDCADTAFCGGIACQTGDDDDDDTGTAPPLLELVYSPEDCCDFTIVQTCPLSIGTIGLINRSTEDAGTIDASCDLVDGLSPIVWQIVETGDPPEAFIIDGELPAATSVTLEAWYNCSVAHGFRTNCRVKAEVGALEVELPGGAIEVTATQSK